MMNQQKHVILKALDVAVNSESVVEYLDAVLTRVEQKLARNKTDLMAWEAVPLSLYGEGLPEAIRSCWVFILRRGASTGAERHPNSHQRSMSYRGSGEFQLLNDGRWDPHPLVSDPDSPIARRWVSIPQNTWHQLFVSERDWAMVSFHTVAAEELIEERPDGPDGIETNRTRQRLYSADHE